MKTVIVALVVMLTGCGHRVPTAEQHRASLEADCRSYGFTPGTSEFSNCLMQAHQQDQQRRQALAQQYMQNMQRNTFTPMQPYNIPIPTQTNCQADNIGVIRCKTY